MATDPDPRAGQRLVADLWCGDVLDLLSDYVDGVLSPEHRAKVVGHLQGCDWCEQFGGAYAGIVGTLRAEVLPPLEGEAAARLRRALEAATKSG